MNEKPYIGGKDWKAGAHAAASARLPSLEEIGNTYKAQRDDLRRVLMELLPAVKRHLLTHGCSLIVSYEGEENRCADCFDLRAAIANATREPESCVNQNQHCGHDECCVCGRRMDRV